MLEAPSPENPKTASQRCVDELDFIPFLSAKELYFRFVEAGGDAEIRQLQRVHRINCIGLVVLGVAELGGLKLLERAHILHQERIVPLNLKSLQSRRLNKNTQQSRGFRRTGLEIKLQA